MSKFGLEDAVCVKMITSAFVIQSPNLYSVVNHTHGVPSDRVFGTPCGKVLHLPLLYSCHGPLCSQSFGFTIL